MKLVAKTARVTAVSGGIDAQSLRQWPSKTCPPSRYIGPKCATAILMLCRPAIVVHELALATDYLSHVIYSDPIGSHPWYRHQKTNEIGSDRDPKSVSAHNGDFYENPNDREP